MLSLSKASFDALLGSGTLGAACTEALAATAERRRKANAAREKTKRSRCLQKCPEFASLDDVAVGQIVDAMEYRVVEAGSVLCAEGAAADELFVLVSGTCDVTIGGSRVNRIEELSVFGETALFSDAKGRSYRGATVTAAGEGDGVRLLSLSKASFDALLGSGALSAACMEALAADAERWRQADAARAALAKQKANKKTKNKNNKNNIKNNKTKKKKKKKKKTSYKL